MKSSARAGFSFRIIFKRSLALSFFFFSFFLFSGQAHAQPSSMLGYWKFDGNTADSSDHGNTGSIQGSPTPGYSGNVPASHFPNTQSAVFGGESSYILIDNQSGVQPTSALTFSMWIYLDAAPDGITKIIGGNYFNSGTPQGFMFSFNNSNAVFTLGNGTDYAAVSFPSNLLTTSVWHHLAGTWDGTTMRFYLNGTERSSLAYAGPVSYSSTVFHLGNFAGRIDDARLYNRPLSVSEISDLSTGNHTSNTWTGEASANYDNPLNWTTDSVPDPYTLVDIPAAAGLTNFPVFASSQMLSGLSIGTGSSLNIGGYNLTVNDLGTFSNDGNLILTNASTQLITGLTNDTNSGAVTVGGTDAGTGLKAGSQYYDLNVERTAATTSNPAALVINRNLTITAGTFTLAGAATVYGDLFLIGGTLDVSGGNYQISLYGNWNRGGGGFQCRSGTVRLMGTNQNISGANQFYNLQKTATAPGTVYFEPGITQVITNNWDFLGSASNIISLRSTTNGSPWMIDPQGTRTISYLDVRDSNNINASPVLTSGYNITDSGGNTNWTFGGAIEPDATAPTLSSVAAVATADSVTVSWISDEAASSQVEYGETSSYGHTSSEFNVDTPTTSHSVEIAGLASCATYHYRALSNDASDNQGMSADQTFTTGGCAVSSGGDASEEDEDTCDLDDPEAPKIVSAEARDSTSIRLKIEEGEGVEDSYKLKYGLKSGSYDWDVDDIEEDEITSFLVEKLSPGTTYYFRVRSENKCGESDWSGEKSAKTDSVPESSTVSQTYSAPVANTEPIPEETVQPIYPVLPPEKTNFNESEDKIEFESPKEKGEVKSDIYSVDNVEMIDDQGKKKLKISGRGIPDSFVTVYIYSDLPTVLSIKTEKDGSWSYVLDGELEDGEHEVYVAVTDNTGKVLEKSEPLGFIKTAQAITIKDPRGGPSRTQVYSPVEKNKSDFLKIIFPFSIGALFLALAALGWHFRRKNATA